MNQNYSNSNNQQQFQHQQAPPYGSNFQNPYQEIPPMGFMEAVGASFEKYADFEGRSRRSEFWYFRLFQVIVIFTLFMLTLIGGAIHEILGGIGVGVIVITYLIFIIPSIASTVRRFHDTGNSGWLLLVDVFCTSGILTIIFGCMDSKWGPNEYGPNPKEQGNNW